MSEEIDHGRRRWLGNAAMTVAGAKLGIFGADDAFGAVTMPRDPTLTKPATNTGFGPLKQINAGLLNVGFAEAGPANGQPVILLHGWPYDIHSYVDVAPLLATAGYRVIAPHLRGHGTTRFLSGARSGTPSKQ